MGGATGQNTRGTVLCQLKEDSPHHARGVKVRGVPPGLTVSKVEGPCAESSGYECGLRDGGDQRGWKDATWGVAGGVMRTGRAEWRSLDFGERELMRKHLP